MKIVDSRNFPVAKTIASSIVTLKPGALRELHWHPNVSIEYFSPSPHLRKCSLTEINPGRRMALLPVRHRSRHRLRRQRRRPHLRLLRRRHGRLPGQLRALYRKHVRQRDSAMDRNLQERPRSGYLADAVAGADAAGDRGVNAEDPGGGCEGVEEGEAVNYRLDVCWGWKILF